MRRLSLLCLCTGLMAMGCDSPCATDADCGSDEMCSAEMCVPRSTGSDAGRRDGGGPPPDASPPADGGNDAGSDGGVDLLPEHQWDFVMPSLGGFDQARAMAIDPTGAVILTGPFSGAPNIAGTEYVSRGESDVYVLRLTSDGTVDWIQTFGSELSDSCRGVATDADGNIYLTGQYQGSDVSIAGAAALPYQTGDGKNVFVASLDSSGAHRWSTGYVGPGTDSGNAVAIAGEHVFVAGFFSETVGLPESTVTSAGDRDALLLSFDRSGFIQWQRTYGGPGNEGVWGLAASDNDKVHLAGYFGQTVTFGAMGERAALGAASDMFVLKVNADGEERQIASFGASDGYAAGRSITMTTDRNVLVGGVFEGSLSLPGTASATATDPDGIVIRLNASLEYESHAVLGGAGAGRVLGVAYSAPGLAFAIGQFDGEMDGVGSSSSTDDDDLFMVALNDDNTVRWTRHFGALDGQDWGWAVATQGVRAVFAGALREGDFDLGGGTRTLPEAEAFAVAYRVR